jgi:hypothetical protein
VVVVRVVTQVLKVVAPVRTAVPVAEPLAGMVVRQVYLGKVTAAVVPQKLMEHTQ